MQAASALSLACDAIVARNLGVRSATVEPGDTTVAVHLQLASEQVTLIARPAGGEGIGRTASFTLGVVTEGEVTILSHETEVAVGWFIECLRQVDPGEVEWPEPPPSEGETPPPEMREPSPYADDQLTRMAAWMALHPPADLQLDPPRQWLVDHLDGFDAATYRDAFGHDPGDLYGDALGDLQRLGWVTRDGDDVRLVDDPVVRALAPLFVWPPEVKEQALAGYDASVDWLARLKAQHQR